MTWEFRKFRGSKLLAESFRINKNPDPIKLELYRLQFSWKLALTRAFPWNKNQLSIFVLYFSSFFEQFAKYQEIDWGEVTNKFWQISKQVLTEYISTATFRHSYLSVAVVIYQTSSYFLLLYSFLFIKLHICFLIKFPSLFIFLKVWLFKEVLLNMTDESQVGNPGFELSYASFLVSGS